jgi:hypothetical protein
MATATPRRDSSAGAYGFKLAGLERARHLLVPAPATWPALEIAVAERQSAPAPPLDRVGPDRAELRLASGGWVAIERAPGRAVYHLPEAPDPAALVHPYLAPVALIAARWLGRESFHAGAFTAGDGVWALLGAKEAGKSTALAWLAAHGHDVICDDALVLDDTTALAGPRSIDLRAESADRLGIGEPLGTVGVRERWRAALDPVPAELPFRGWVSLEWGDDVAVEPVRGAARLAALTPHRGVFLEPTRPELLVEYAAKPHWRLRRPRGWGSLDESLQRLLDALAG